MILQLTITKNRDGCSQWHRNCKVSIKWKEWDAMVEPTKFNNCDQEPWQNCDFGKFKTGKISIQDHPGVISFRNIKILEL